MQEKQYEQRCYSLVNMYLSPIQMGIQAGHATDEYEVMFGQSSEYKQWVRKDKTVIILNGGTSNSTGNNLYNDKKEYGTMETNLAWLKEFEVPVAAFYEPSLNNALTAISFLADERCWDYDKYPDPVIWHNPCRSKEIKIQEIHDVLIEQHGKKVTFLREFIKQFKLA